MNCCMLLVDIYHMLELLELDVMSLRKANHKISLSEMNKTKTRHGFPGPTVNYGNTVIYGKGQTFYGEYLLVYGDQKSPGLTVNYGDTVIYGRPRIVVLFLLF